MEINLSERNKQILSVLILLLLPLLFILLGLFVDIKNAWFFISMVTWFGMGVILMAAIN